MELLSGHGKVITKSGISLNAGTLNRAFTVPCSRHSHISFRDTSNGNSTVRASIAISKIKAKFTYNINKLHYKVVKMFTANNSNCHLMEWAVSLAKKALRVSFKILTYSRLDYSFSCPT
jgi:hypothetical protein